MLPDEAVIVVVPARRAVTKPCETRATAVSDELQVAVDVTFSRAAPVENTRVAVNCRVSPIRMDGLDGVIMMETLPTACEVTVSVA